MVLPIYKGKGDPMGVWILQRDHVVGTCYESGRKDF